MRASKLIRPEPGDEMIVVQSYYADIARCLVAQERAIEALAEDAGAGPARRIKVILDGEE